MKTLTATLALSACFALSLSAQVSFGLRLGKSPSVSPGTAHLIVNRNDPFNESLFNVQQVQFTEQLGFMVRTDGPHFWFMAEVLYGRSMTRYSMMYTREAQLGATPPLYHERKSFLDIPLSFGVKLGVFEVFSGFNVTKDLNISSELSMVDGFEMLSPQVQLGFHSGLGVNFGHVLIDMRYQQQFSNYGQGQFIHDQELLLKNAPGRLLATAAFRI